MDESPLTATETQLGRPLFRSPRQHIAITVLEELAQTAVDDDVRLAAAKALLPYEGVRRELAKMAATIETLQDRLS